MNKMTDDDWKKLKYMSKSDNWGNPSQIDKQLAFNIDNMRIFSGKPIVLTSPAFTSGSGHVGNSMHYEGKAADLVIKGSSVLEMYILAERFNFTGIGLYPNKGNSFIHVDVRPSDIMNVQFRWIAIGDPNNWTYVELNYDNMKRYII